MSVWILREDFDEAAKQAGHLMLPSVLEDAWQDFATYSGTMADFHKDRKVRCPHRYAAPVADTSEEPALYSVEAQRKYATAHSVEELTSLLEANGLKPGFVKKRSADDGDDMSKPENNPYDDAYLKTHTKAQREAKIQSLLTKHATLAGQLSAKAGKTIMNQPIVSPAARYAAEHAARVANSDAARSGEKR